MTLTATLEQPLGYVLACATLTPSELEILQLLVDGLSVKQIARQRNGSGKTINAHLNNAYRKLGAHTQLQAVLVALRAGVVVL